MKIDVNPRIFNRKYYRAFGRFKRSNYIYGGSSSSKTYSIVQYIIIQALAGEAALVARATAVSLRKTIWVDFLHIISDMGISNLFEVNKTELYLKSKVSVGSIQLVGTDNDADNVKGIKPNNGQGAFSILMCEEADQISKSAVIQLNLRLRGKKIGGYKTRAFYVFNPVFFLHWLFQDEIIKTGFDPYNDWEYEDEKTLILRCKYTDNDYLEQEEIDFLEGLGEKSAYYKQVYLDSEPGVLGDRVFENVEIIPRSAIPTSSKLKVAAGIDFGWQDPTAFTLMYVDHSERIIYIIDGFSKSKLDHISIAERIKVIYKKYGISNRGVRIYGDSEDPRLIKQLCSEGLYVQDAKKPPGSVLSGLMVLNTYTIKVVDDLKDHCDSVQNYTWKQKDGVAIDEPDHTWSHIPDSIRYGNEDILRGYGGVQFSHK